MATYRHAGAKVTTEQVAGKWYAHGMGQAATGATEAEALAKVKPLIAKAKRDYNARPKEAPRKTKRFRVKLATGDEYEIEAFSLKEARDEANRRLYEKRRREGRF